MDASVAEAQASPEIPVFGFSGLGFIEIIEIIRGSGPGKFGGVSRGFKESFFFDLNLTHAHSVRGSFEPFLLYLMKNLIAPSQAYCYHDVSCFVKPRLLDSGLTVGFPIWGSLDMCGKTMHGFHLKHLPWQRTIRSGQSKTFKSIEKTEAQHLEG